MIGTKTAKALIGTVVWTLCCALMALAGVPADGIGFAWVGGAFLVWFAFAMAHVP